ncbi:MAG: hypothetical protein ACI83B_000043 [Sediminicola sp.]|jgi:hypothetical protein
MKTVLILAFGIHLKERVVFEHLINGNRLNILQ